MEDQEMTARQHAEAIVESLSHGQGELAAEQYALALWYAHADNDDLALGYGHTDKDDLRAALRYLLGADRMLNFMYFLMDKR